VNVIVVVPTGNGAVTGFDGRPRVATPVVEADREVLVALGVLEELHAATKTTIAALTALAPNRRVLT
jgi:hypothetical protein